ncbi:MAG: nicotinate-nucleotide adenylyltransferase [Gammaproteobacteria bacterium]|nr:nicotinate-nucleotide adenylyltransferase [Gammaproteobacteria bacterium]
MGIFGGTFDPIHYGHLRTAFELLEMLSLTEMRFLPNGDPPHRDGAIADAQHRLGMVGAAIAGQPGFVLDDREVYRAGPSYSVDTLSDMRAEFPARSLCLMVGMDAFLGLPRWYQWQQVLQLAHVVVAHRPGWQAPDAGALGELLRERGTDKIDDLHHARAGSIYVHAVTQLEISSTALRDLICSGGDPRFLIPDPVRAYITEHNCYPVEKSGCK